jgi:hypothetical protein
MEAMKVIDQRGTPTRFDGADVGDYLYEVGEKDPRRLCLKIPLAGLCNIVCLGTGQLAAFNADELVQVVEVEMFVTSNTPEMPGGLMDDKPEKESVDG